ncbi:MAG: hypothetical protein AAGG65_21370 [Pseudomonadota bacterium]
MPEQFVENLGLLAVIIMVVSYALERVGSIFVAIFALGCVLAATYAYLIDSLPFLIAEGIWAVVAARRWWRARRAEHAAGA